ncbi:hypothetical protein ACFOQM_12755 [Paenibacillus sp. GCM10012307]|uniref:Uncharacterized protein n=1 Tax=Paenibacillus roseus TaxID=2798579 RepID=A0A934J5W2_9BACL|nr:hypothetical protein [Paenibacillus roseus]MBJ6362163.1 hypothetical protein [Paenibacillus roseus]
MNVPSQTQPAVTPIYHCCSEVHQVLHSVRSQLHQLCNEHIHRLVKIETIDGDVFEGHVAHFDNSYLYLNLSHPGYTRAFVPGFGFPGSNPNSNFILPLVLFNLLTISLL